MRKIFIILIIVLMLLLSACSSNSTVTEEQSSEYFPLVKVGSDGCYTILVDKETGVTYLRSSYSYGEALIVMIEADGSPKIYDI